MRFMEYKNEKHRLHCWQCEESEERDDKVKDGESIRFACGQNSNAVDEKGSRHRLCDIVCTDGENDD